MGFEHPEQSAKVKVARFVCPVCKAVDYDDDDPWCDGTIFVDHQLTRMIEIPEAPDFEPDDRYREE